MPAGIRGGDLRRPRLAGDILGNAGAAAIGAFCALSGSGRKLSAARPDLSSFREPRGDRPSGGAARGRSALAARSRWRAALSGRREIAVVRTSGPADRAGAALCAAARHGGGRAQRAGELAWHEHGEGPGGETGVVRRAPEAWGDVILARKETPTSYHLSVVIDDALQGVTDVVRGRTCSGRPACTGCCSDCSVCRNRFIGITGSSKIRPGISSQNRRRPQLCANCVAQGVDAGGYSPARRIAGQSP